MKRCQDIIRKQKEEVNEMGKKLEKAEVNAKLEEEGYIILRFWGNEINKNLEGCVEKIEAALASRGYKKIPH